MIHLIIESNHMASLNIISFKSASSNKARSPRRGDPFTIHINNTPLANIPPPIKFSDYSRSKNA